MNSPIHNAAGVLRPAAKDTAKSPNFEVCRFAVRGRLRSRLRSLARSSNNWFGPLTADGLRAAWTVRRALQISDPVERLRFLRKGAPCAYRSYTPPRPSRFLPLLCIGPMLLLVGAAAKHQTAAPIPSRPAAVAAPATQEPTSVWRVESHPDYEIYSNGLRIDNRYAVETRPRSYLALPAGGHRSGSGKLRNDPAGIVFHTTQSAQAPFEADENQRLRLIGESLLEYVRDKRAYNFVIDRLGRVFRIVREENVANHAGHSIWADGRWLYIGLNESFIGVAFEARTDPDSPADPETGAQVQAGAELVEMLRSRYHIPGLDCVTHAQVSVNPSNMRIGYHTDWGSSFPFESMRLPDNYATPLPAVWGAGFTWDPAFLKSAGSRLYVGMAVAEDQVRKAAADAGIPAGEYRERLRNAYREDAALVAARQGVNHN